MINEFLKRKQQKEGMILFLLFLIFSYQSLLFSYPRVEEKGIIALLNEVTDFLIQENSTTSNSFLPDYFLITNDLLDGIQYCIDKYSFSLLFIILEKNILQNYDKL